MKRARKEEAQNWVSYRSLRDSLIERGLLQDEGDPTHYDFAEDVSFASLSGAAAVVAAGNRNGRTYWRVPSRLMRLRDTDAFY